MRSVALPARRAVVAVVASASMCAGVALSNASTGATAAYGSNVTPPAPTDPLLVDRMFIELWNAQRIDDMRALMTEDMVFVFPNYEPFRGADAVVRFFKQMRPLLGEFQRGTEIHKIVRNRDLCTLSVSYTLTNGLRSNDTEVLARQPDGTWKYTIGATGFRDPLR